MPNYKVTYGGWYQRTTLHLSEVYNFFAFAYTNTDLSKEKLQRFRESLHLSSVTREVGYLEYVRAITESGIEIKYFEDGLYILNLSSPNIKEGQEILARYFEEIFNPAIQYLFSLGAPTPKVLANIRSFHPTVVTLVMTEPEKFTVNEAEFGVVYSRISSESTIVFKTRDYIFIIAKFAEGIADELVDMQIFFREYKDQLEKYLNIHRKVWEEIEEIKEKKQVRGSELEKIRKKLDRYQKTVSLINSRIIQMESYVETRQEISRELDVEKHLNKLFQYKFETLADSREYIEELWVMTTDYLNSAIQVIVELKNQSTKNSITSLTVITTLGVVASILTYLSRESLPKVTSYGIIFFIFLIFVTWAINKLINYFFKNMKYKLTLGDTEKNI